MSQSIQQTIVGRNLNYNQAKEIIQSENYLNAADKSIIRRRRELENRKSGHSHFPYGADIAYEAVGLFTEEIVSRYCDRMGSNGQGASQDQIHQDTENICELYQLVLC